MHMVLSAWSIIKAGLFLLLLSAIRGVPQGSILGSFSFIISTRWFPNILRIVTFKCMLITPVYVQTFQKIKLFDKIFVKFIYLQIDCYCIPMTLNTLYYDK